MVNANIKMYFSQYDSLELSILYYLRRLSKWIVSMMQTTVARRFLIILHMLFVSLLVWLNIFLIRTVNALRYGQWVVTFLSCVWLSICVFVFIALAVRAVERFYGPFE